MFVATIISVLSFAVVQLRAEVFTAMADMENLLDAESEIVTVIDQYIQKEQERLKRLKSIAKDYKEQNKHALKDGSQHLANPVNAFLVIKRLTSSWDDVESIMRYNNAEEFLRNISTQRVSAAVKFPGKEDLDGAAVALLRLQDTYKLPTEEIASGRIRGTTPSEGLSALDCFELCRIAYNLKDYYHTLMWSQEALARIRKENPPTIEAVEVLEYLSFSLYQQGNTERALHVIRQLHQLNADHPRAAGNIKYYEDLLKADGKKVVKEDDDEDLLPPVNNPRKDYYSSDEEWVSYEKLCRGESPIRTKAYEASLHCYYKNTHPYYEDYIKFAPLKAEVVHWKPKIIIYRNVITDSEIETIKELAYPKLKRATVFNAKGELEPAEYRTAKSAWLKNYEDPVVETVNKRIDLMTNLEMETAEELQIANYGLGGHYEPHFDMSTVSSESKFGGGTGNRIATVLFYMEAPEAGGATIYTRLHLPLFPTKYDAAFWHNIKQNGEPDLSTRHAACPVLAGQKWVANKWIHERGQEFRRQCSLTEDEYE